MFYVFLQKFFQYCWRHSLVGNGLTYGAAVPQVTQVQHEIIYRSCSSLSSSIIYCLNFIMLSNKGKSQKNITSNMNKQ